MKFDWRDLTLRFLLGGAAVAACYIFLGLIPWKTFAGIFAAFPAVMAAAVIIAGTRESSQKAADVALGAISGMMGCAFCVLSAIIFMNMYSSWSLALILSLIVWFISSAICFRFVGMFVSRRTAICREEGKAEVHVD